MCGILTAHPARKKKVPFLPASMLLTRRTALPALAVMLIGAPVWMGPMAAREERLALTVVLACAAPMGVLGWLGLMVVLACVVPMGGLGWPGLTAVQACAVPMAILEWLGLTAASKQGDPDIFRLVWAALMAVLGWPARAVLTALAWVDRVMAMAVLGWPARAVLTALAWVDRVMATAVLGWPVPVTAARGWVISTTAVPA